MGPTHHAGLPADNFGDTYREDLRFFEKAGFVVCAMFTPDKPRLARCADRLARSCERYELPYRICRVPRVHRSMSPSGTDDIVFSKPNFVKCSLSRFPDKGVLYTDVDMVFMGYPEDVAKASRAGYDFAVYNWLHDEHNEAYLPMNRRLERGNRQSDYYVFSHSINFLSDEQLLCSGGVQFYGNSGGARALIGACRDFIGRNPEYADDECLDYVYNNFFAGSQEAKTLWLDKSYLRFPWWPHVRPVILHPELHPGRQRRHIDEVDGRKRFYPERCRQNTSDFIFPEGFVIDTRERLLLRFVNDRLVERRPAGRDFWIYPEDEGFA